MPRGTARLRADVKDVERALAAVERASTPPAVTDALEAGMRVFKDGARTRAPRRSGALADSIELSREGETVTVGTNSAYALIQEFGGTIGAKKARRLNFVDGNKVVFARKVRIEGQPYMLPTFYEDASRAEDAFENEFNSNFNA